MSLHSYSILIQNPIWEVYTTGCCLVMWSIHFRKAYINIKKNMLSCVLTVKTRGLQSWRGGSWVGGSIPARWPHSRRIRPSYSLGSVGSTCQGSQLRWYRTHSQTGSYPTVNGMENKHTSTQSDTHMHTPKWWQLCGLVYRYTVYVFVTEKDVIFTNSSSCNVQNQMIYQEKCRSESQTEDHGASQVCLIHYAAVCCLHWMEHRQSLLPDVVKVDS